MQSLRPSARADRADGELPAFCDYPFEYPNFALVRGYEEVVTNPVTKRRETKKAHLSVSLSR